MGIEIEQKFLINNDDWKPLVVNSFSIKQGYLNLDTKRTVRVRIKDDQAYITITIKGKTKGVSRAEFEYQIPLQDGEQLTLLSVCSEINYTFSPIL